MINFRSKYFTILVWIITCYMFYSHSSKILNSQSVENNESKISSSEASIKLDIDPNKNYNDYTILQKILYYFYREPIDIELNKYKSKTNRIKEIPVRNGNTVRVSYDIAEKKNFEDIVMTKNAFLSILPKRKIYDDLVGLYIGDIKIIKDDNQIFHIKVESIN